MPATINFILYCTGEPSAVRQNEEIQVRNTEMERNKTVIICNYLLL